LKETEEGREGYGDSWFEWEVGWECEREWCEYAASDEAEEGVEDPGVNDNVKSEGETVCG
jgi:hypothetical protein